MTLLKKAFGEYQTNCYILRHDRGAIVIDPGIGADKWVIEQLGDDAPLCIINTHGHFDHVWSNSTLKERYPDTPLILPELDKMLTEKDEFNLGMPLSYADILVACDNKSEILEVKGVKIEFLHFPGHTPGCCMVRIGDYIFSGDFIFNRSIGRSDFMYSNHDDMKASLERFRDMKFDTNLTLYPGHGENTDIFSEQKNMVYWLRHFR